MRKQLLSKNEIFDVIVNCYQSDNDLVNKYHVIAGSGLSSCVDRTVYDFVNNDISIYKVVDNKDFIGYFGEEIIEDELFLTGFFIMPQFRTSKTKDSFWNMVINHFNSDFKIGLYNNNTRAINFLEKQGCILDSEVKTQDGVGHIYKFMKEIA